MKLPCAVIRDLLPLYAENMVSAESRSLTQAHLAECESCRAALSAMTQKEPDIQQRLDTAQEFVRFEKKSRRKHGWKVAAITALAVSAFFLVCLVLGGFAVAFFMLDSFLSKVKVDTDVSHYSDYMGANAKKEYRSKWGMDESIFPARITDRMNVQEYKMVYYNPWDAQFLSYLTVSYSPEDYAAETVRLTALGITDYKGYYTVTGFADDADPIAMYADSYQGFVYAMHTPGRENTITYVELIFCNCFYDLDYPQYIPAEYLPEGFDATLNNPYSKTFDFG